MEKNLEKHQRLIGKLVRDLDPSKTDRIIMDVLHEEDDGLVCVSTREAVLLEFEGKDWVRRSHFEESLTPKGQCRR